MTLLSVHTRRLVLRALAVAAAALALSAPPAWGHAAFVGSSPPPGTRLEQSPPKVTLRFTEPLDRKLSRATLVAVDSGERLQVEVTAPRSNELELVPVGPLRRGAYRVEWHTVSTQDGHALEGTFSFGVGAPAAGDGHSLEQSPLARDGWLRVLARVAMYATLLMFTGALLLELLLGRGRRPAAWLVPAGVPQQARLRRRARAVAVDIGLLAAAAAAAAAVADAADAAGTLSAAGLSDYLLGGLPGFARLATILFVLVAAWLAARGRRAAAAPAALALLAVAASGHASSAEPRVPTILLDWVHLSAGAVWLGGIALLVAVWGPSLRAGRDVRRTVARQVLPVFGRVALPAFIVVASTGAVSALVQLGHVQALWETAYGRVLSVKVALVALIAVFSYTHALRLRPRLVAANPHPNERTERRHWRLLRSEPLLGLGVVAAVALLAAFPLPPRQLGEADEAVAAGPPCDPCPLPRPAADQLAVAERAGSRLIAGWLRRNRERLTGTVRIQDVDGKPATARARMLGARQSACGPGCWRFSTRSARATVDVAMREGGRRYVARLPARWIRGQNSRARRLLERTQHTMARLRGLREVEAVTSGPGSFARTVYRLRAPNRFAYATDGGSESVVIGPDQWFRTEDSDWRRQRYSGGGPPFRTRSWFRWTPYAQEIRLLRLGAGTAELALMDPGTPVWLRLVVDLDTMRTVRERMIARAHYMTRHYLDFNKRVPIRAPAD